MELGQRVEIMVPNPNGRPKSFVSQMGQVVAVTNQTVSVASRGKTYSRRHNEVWRVKP